MTDLTRKYSETERKLFEEEYKAATMLEKWKDAPVVSYHPSPMAILDEVVVAPLAIAGGAEAEREPKRLRK